MDTAKTYRATDLKDETPEIGQTVMVCVDWGDIPIEQRFAFDTWTENGFFTGYAQFVRYWLKEVS